MLREYRVNQLFGGAVSRRPLNRTVERRQARHHIGGLQPGFPLLAAIFRPIERGHIVGRSWLGSHRRIIRYPLNSSPLDKPRLARLSSVLWALGGQLSTQIAGPGCPRHEPGSSTSLSRDDLGSHHRGPTTTHVARSHRESHMTRSVPDIHIRPGAPVDSGPLPISLEVAVRRVQAGPVMPRSGESP